MHAYIIARVNIDDADTFHRYEQAFADVFQEYMAEVLVADDAVRVLEGEWPAMRTAIIIPRSIWAETSPASALASVSRTRVARSP